MKKKRSISQSQINLFKKCPYAYELKYSYHKHPIFFDPSLFEVGSRVHDAIDKYYKGHYTPEFTENEILMEVYNILKYDWDTTLPADYLRKAYQCLQNFAIWEHKNQIQPLTEVKIYAGDLMGIIDYFDIYNKKIIDFKTNTRAFVGYNNKVQAVMYKMLVKEKFDIDIDKFLLYYLYPGEYREVKIKNVDKIENDIKDNVKKIQEAWRRHHFPKIPKTPKTCNGCEYNYYCGGVS